jgi:hypothetical protein
MMIGELGSCEMEQWRSGAASGILIADDGLSQIDFAHVVSTNYSQYKMWWFEQ